MEKNCMNCGYCNPFPEGKKIFEYNNEDKTTIEGKSYGRCILFDYIFIKYNSSSSDTFVKNCPYFSTIEELVEEDSLRREEDFIEMWLTS